MAVFSLNHRSVGSEHLVIEEFIENGGLANKDEVCFCGVHTFLKKSGVTVSCYQWVLSRLWNL